MRSLFPRSYERPVLVSSSSRGAKRIILGIIDYGVYIQYSTVLYCSCTVARCILTIPASTVPTVLATNNIINNKDYKYKLINIS